MINLSENQFANAPAQIVIIVIGGAILAGVGWVVKLQIKQTILLDRLIRAIFPEGKLSVPDQMELLKDSVNEIKTKGSDQLREIIREARLERIENANERQRLIAIERNQNNQNNQGEI